MTWVTASARQIAEHLGDVRPDRRPARARELNDRALDMARDIATVIEQSRALDGLGLLARKAGGTEAAAAHLHDAAEVYDRTGSRYADRARQSLSACV